MDRIETRGKGSIAAVFGSGITTISLSLMACQPRLLEPLKPSPPVKVSVSSLEVGARSVAWFRADLQI